MQQFVIMVKPGQIEMRVKMVVVMLLVLLVRVGGCGGGGGGGSMHKLPITIIVLLLILLFLLLGSVGILALHGKQILILLLSDTSDGYWLSIATMYDHQIGAVRRPPVPDAAASVNPPPPMPFNRLPAARRRSRRCSPASTTSPQSIASSRMISADGTSGGEVIPNRLPCFISIVSLPFTITGAIRLRNTSGPSPVHASSASASSAASTTSSSTIVIVVIGVTVAALLLLLLTPCRDRLRFEGPTMAAATDDDAELSRLGDIGSELVRGVVLSSTELVLLLMAALPLLLLTLIAVAAAVGRIRFVAAPVTYGWCCCCCCCCCLEGLLCSPAGAAAAVVLVAIAVVGRNLIVVFRAGRAVLTVELLLLPL
uniref:Uncharacterized protein n=1 Tax=Anopheles farauti TaxID=69004 RepID=A0A182QKU7_9DIPT